MRRLLCAILALVMMLSCFMITTSAAIENEAYSFEDSNDFSSLNNASISYDSYLNAVAIKNEVANAETSFKINTVGAFSKIALWLPATAADEELTISVNGQTSNVIAGHKFVIVDCSLTSSIDVKYTSTDIYTIFWYGVGTNEELLLDEANGTLNNYTEEELVLNTYDIEKYTKYLWNTEIVYNDTFFPLSNAEGKFDPIQLSYDIDRIVSVRNSYMNKEYIYGVDYVVEDGKLILLQDTTSMLTYSYKSVYDDTKTSWRKTLSGTYEYCGQYQMFFVGYVNVTYTTKSDWGGAIPEAKNFLIPKTMEKLNTSGSDIKFLAVGDSISGGANVSSEVGVQPYADIWHEMVTNELQNRYSDVNIELKVIAQGGASAALCVEKMDEILAYQPDVVMIEFGVNECMQGDSTWKNGGYVDTIKQAISSINANLPDCEIILVGQTISNTDFFPEKWFCDYMDSLYTLERTGVAVADVTSMYQYLLTQKRYIDMSGDNLCHPSDFATRLIVQPILRIFDEGTEQEYISGLSQRILKYRFENKYLSEQWNELQDKEAIASQNILNCTTVSDALNVYYQSTTELKNVQTEEDLIASQKLDMSNLIFDSSRSADCLKSSINATTKYDSSEKAISSTITSSRNPYYVINYAAGDTTVNADDYDYVVITMAVGANNGTKSTTTKFTFTVGGTALTADSVVHKTRDGIYNSYILDMSSKSGWTGVINELKVNIFASSSTNDVLYLDSIILCKDLGSAKDAAIEREIVVNGEVPTAITYLMSDDVTSGILDASSENENSYLCGDSNEDGIINAKDLIKLRKYLAGCDVIISNVDALDADKDGEVTTSDSTYLRKVIVGISPVLQSGESKKAEVKYNSKQEAAEIKALVDNPTISVDISESGISLDEYKYLTLCAKTANGESANVTVTITNTNGDIFTGSIEISEGDKFSANTAKLTDSSGTISNITFTFDCNKDDIIYFDSFVLTPTISSAKNVEIVRIGAANLI